MATFPNPTALLAATTAQVPAVAAYNALNVPGMAAGVTYFDPVTGVKVYKATSAVYPLANSGFFHDYAEGGHEISLPHTGNTRTILGHQAIADGGAYYLIDFLPGFGFSNARVLTGNFRPRADLCFTFSSNAATPYYAYVANADAGFTQVTIRRFDIRTMTEAPGQGWPLVEPAGVENFPIWLQQNKDDTFFCWMRGSDGPTLAAYEPLTATLKTITIPTCNEPRIDREGRYVGISMATTPTDPGNGLQVWDTVPNVITWTAPGDSGQPPPIANIPFAHFACLRRRFMGSQYNNSFPPTPLWVADPSVPNSQVLKAASNSSGNPMHANGSWVQGTAALDDQYALFNFYGAVQPAQANWLVPGGMLLATPNGDYRALAHAYNASISGDLNTLAYAKFSPDGLYVLFASDMNGQPRTDLFLAEMPTITIADAPPTRSHPVSWNASPEANVAGYKLRWTRGGVPGPGSPKDVGNNLEGTIEVDADGIWSVTVSAYNTSNQESIGSATVIELLCRTPAPSRLRKTNR